MALMDSAVTKELEGWFTLEHQVVNFSLGGSPLLLDVLRVVLDHTAALLNFTLLARQVDLGFLCLE
jgi:hypothetical protein